MGALTQQVDLYPDPKTGELLTYIQYATKYGSVRGVTSVGTGTASGGKIVPNPGTIAPPASAAATGPAPTTQAELEQLQLDRAKRLAQIQDALFPSALEAEGLTMTTDPTTGKISITKKANPEQDKLDAQARSIQTQANQRTLDAMSGKLAIDPSVESDISQGQAQLRAELLRKLGPGAEGSDSWNRAMAEFQRQSDSMRYGIRHGEMTTADAIATNRQNQGLRTQGQSYGELQDTTAPYARTAGVLAGTLSPYFNQQVNAANLAQSERNSKRQLIGDALGAAGAGIGAFAALSDERLKEGVATLENVLWKIDGVRGVKYNFTDGPKDHIGVIAQEVRKVFPELVEEGEDGLLRVNYGGLAAVAIQAVKELGERVKALEAK